MNESPPSRASGRAFSRLSLRTQLVVTVNVFVGVAVLIFLYLDYRAGLGAMLDTKSGTLIDEARTLAAAARTMSAEGADVVQAYIDEVCIAMDAADSPGHFIEVTFGGRTLRSHAHGSPGAGSGTERIEGRFERDGVRATVSELAAPVVRSARRATLGRTAVVLFAALGAAVLANVLLLRLVTRPLHGLLETVRAVAGGRYETPIVCQSNAELNELARELGSMSAELDRRERDRTAHLARAMRLQRHLMTGGGVDGRRVAVEYHPADEIAGDFVDVLPCDNGDVLLCLADVVGHGIAAAMGAAVLKALLVSIDCSRSSPKEVLGAINTGFLHASLPEDIASMILVRVAADGRKAIYASAGHDTCYLRRADGHVEELVSTGAVLGVVESPAYSERTLELAAGDVLLLISDGITEARDGRDELFGASRVADTLARVGQGARETASGIVAAARAHQAGAAATDDMTALAFAIGGPDHRGRAQPHRG